MRVIGIVSMLFALLLAVPSNAAVMLQIKEHTDPGIWVRLSGSLDLTGLGDPTRQKLDFETAPLIDAAGGYVGAGLPGWNDSNLFADVYKDAFSSPLDAFGTGGPAHHWSNSTTSGFFAIALAQNALLLPAGYESNDEIRAFTNYVGAPGFTLKSLGLEVGTYDFDLRNGDRVTVEVAPVPLPPSALLLGAGLIGLVAAARARRGATAA